MSNRFQELQELLPLRRLTSLDLSENKIPQAQTDWSHLLLLTVDVCCLFWPSEVTGC